MYRRISIMGCLLVFTLILSCKKETVDSKLIYNQKANELIQQLISEESCDCVLEIPKESIIEINETERPVQAPIWKKRIIEKLELKNESSLDSLIAISDNFILNKNFLNQKSIKLITRENLFSEIKNSHSNSKFFKMCPKGILYFHKPIFDKSFKNAVIETGPAFTCIPGGIYSYTYKAGKWIEK